MTHSQPALLDVTDLTIESAPTVRVIDGISFSLNAGETLALVGESGAGKSLTALALMRLLPKNALTMTSGSMTFQGQDLATLSDGAMRRIRGGEIAMIFQDPLTALNPVLTIGRQLVEAIRLHNDMSKAQARARAVELLDMVRIPAASARLNDYVHRLSGGMRQRVMIAMALAGLPKIILADEPTTALDVTISAQILDLLASLQKELGLGMLFITHDLRSVRSLAHRVAVMYSGRIVETGTVADVFNHPTHPYSEGLLQARPHGNFASDGHRLLEIPGTVPAPAARPAGCAFAPRCPVAMEACGSAPPVLSPAGTSGHQAACYRLDAEVAA